MSPKPEKTRPPNAPNSLGIYVHWPFCSAICPYCDFNVYPAPAPSAVSGAHNKTDLQAYHRAYQRDLTHAHKLRPNAVVDTVFFGGGTPSLMPPALIADLLAGIDNLWGLAKNAEISLEANPVSAPQKQLAALRAAGITRLSLGVQSLDDAALKFLGRTHNAQAALTAFAAAQDLFPACSLDLIYARPQQSLHDWKNELAQALALGLTHLSAYQLTLEPDTAFFKRHARGFFTMPDDDLAADMWLATQDMCASAGLPAYEISNHAVSGAAARHNVATWRGGDYVGIGAGAHGRLTTAQGRLATYGFARPQDWLQGAGEHGWQVMKILSPYEILSERILLGLRLVDGLLMSDLEQAAIASGAENLTLNPQTLHDLRAQNLLCANPERLAATRQGRLVLNRLMAELLADWR